MTAPLPQVFADPVLNQEFFREGYVVVPYLGRREIDSLRRLYQQTLPETISDFYTTLFDKDVERQRLVSTEIEKRVPPLADLLPGYYRIVNSFISKRAGTVGKKLAYHHDYTLADESVHTSVHLWCPLGDVNEKNGCLTVIAGSHALPNPHHIAAMPAAVPPARVAEADAFSRRLRLGYNPSPFDSVRATMEAECAKSVPMKAGQLFCFHEGLLHASGDNSSPDVRLAWGSICLPEGVRPRVFTWDYAEPHRFNVLELEDAFALRLGAQDPVGEPYPKGVTKIGTIEYRHEQLTEERLAPLRVGRKPVTASSPKAAPAGEVKRSWFTRVFKSGVKLNG
jgi:hypothetical protein